MAVQRMQPQMPKTCYHCGRSGHSATECRFKEVKCFACNKVGHLSQVCRSKGQGEKAIRVMKTQPKLQTAHQVEQAEDDEEESLELKHIYPVSKPKAVPLTTQVKLNGRCSTMEIDTGAAVTVISATTYKTMWGPSPPLLRESTTMLRAYGGRVIKVLETLKAKIQEVDRAPPKQLQLYVVEGN